MKEALKKGRFQWRLLTAFLRCDPQFVIIGANKCGTTSLSRYLEASPCVRLAFRQEVHYFDLHFSKGRSWHRAHFVTAVRLRLRQLRTGRPRITGTSAPYYLFHPEVPARMVSQGFSAKFLVLLRDPVERAFSHYHHQVRKGRETLPFEEALERETKRLAGEAERLKDPDYRGMNHRRYSYLARGRYVEQLKRWLVYFPKENFLVVKSEDLFADPQPVLDEVADFLGIPRFKMASYVKHNVNPCKDRMVPETCARLSEYFRPYNRKLGQLLGRDMGWEEFRSQGYEGCGAGGA